jgi:RNA polymerase sigma-70 factor (ECF subfamily)
MPFNIPDDTALLSLLAQDDETAFQILFDKYRGKIFSVAYVYVKSSSVAEEIVQDVFLKVWFQRKDLQNIRNFKSWLYTVSKNYIINYLEKIANEQKARRYYSELHVVSEDNCDFKVRDNQYTQLLTDAIQQLPAQQQKIYTMAKQGELSYESIATKLNISRLTVKTHMARALESIRSYIKAHGGALMVVCIMINFF